MRLAEDMERDANPQVALLNWLLAIYNKIELIIQLRR